MPWLAVPFEEHEVRSALSGRFSVMGIPRLVIVGPNGEASTVKRDAVPSPAVRRTADPTAAAHAGSAPCSPTPTSLQTIASDARVAVQNDEAGEQYPWRGASTSGQALLG